jgi:hypothetical protein
MNPRFYIGALRYRSIATSRYKDHTYGKTMIKEPEPEREAKEHGTYGALLFDKRWIAKRAQILLRDNNRCIICGEAEKLQIHHRQYHFVKALKKFKAPWDYEDHLMITLCERCHSRGHSKYRVPNVYL